MILSFLAWSITILVTIVLIKSLIYLFRWRRVVNTYFFITETVLEFSEMCLTKYQVDMAADVVTVAHEVKEAEWYVMQLKAFRYKTSFWESGDDYWNSRNFKFIRALTKIWDESLIAQLNDPQKQILIRNLMTTNHIRNISDLCVYVKDKMESN